MSLRSPTPRTRRVLLASGALLLALVLALPWVATPLIGAAKALYLDQRGELPPRQDALLKRKLRARLDRVRERARDVTDRSD